MTLINISNIDIKFPFQPYPCQLLYMNKILESCITSQNCLLESPTGTGKTLSLLCSTLGYLEAQAVNFTRIIYSSRTHSQLTQVIKELKSTEYKPKMTILGSREQMCVHPEIKLESGIVQNNKCRTLVANQACKYHKRVKDFNSKNELLDLEDLVIVGEENTVCPYFLSRENQNDAKIIFVPYNYIIDPKIRATILPQYFENAILIFDEAHNLESVCVDAASFDFTTADLACCISEVDKCISAFQNPTFVNNWELKIEDICGLKSALLKLETCIDKFVVPEQGISFPGIKMHEILAEAGIRFENRADMYPVVQGLIEMILDDSTQSNKKCQLSTFSELLSIVFKNDYAPNTLAASYKTHIADSKTKGNNPSNFFAVKSSEVRTLSWWCFNAGIVMRDLKNLGIRNIILTSGTLSPLDSFAFEMQIPFPIRLENSHIIKPSQIWIGVIKNGPTNKRLNCNYEQRSNIDYIMELGNTVVNFSKHISFGVLVFFTSYTILQNCLEKWGWTSDMQFKPPLIDDKGKKLKPNNFNPNSGADLKNLKTLAPGAVILNQTESSTETIISRLLKNKFIIIEPRSSADLASTLNEYKTRVMDPSKNGAIMFAVMRGKVAEGLDFADKYGRGVIITGLPFPSAMDARVKLKKEYLDNYKPPTFEQIPQVSTDLFNRTKSTLFPLSNSNNSANSTNLNPNLVPPHIHSDDKKSQTFIQNLKPIRGDTWYNQQASRAVNQAIGRVIRHKNDFGAILLADERFAADRNSNAISAWLRPNISVFDNYGESLRSMLQFFKNNPEPDLIPSDSDTFSMKKDDDTPREARIKRLKNLFSDIPQYTNLNTISNNESFQTDYLILKSKIIESAPKDEIIKPNSTEVKKPQPNQVIEHLKLVLPKSLFNDFKNNFKSLHVLKPKLANIMKDLTVKTEAESYLSCITKIIFSDEVKISLFEKVTLCETICIGLPSQLQPLFKKIIKTESDKCNNISLSSNFTPNVLPKMNNLPISTTNSQLSSRIAPKFTVPNWKK